MPRDYTTRPRTCHAQKTEWREGMARVQDEAAGMLTVDIIDSPAGSALLDRAIAGNYEAHVLFQAVAQAIARVHQAPRNRPVLCVCCPRPVRRVTPATVFGVAGPDTPTRTCAVGFVFCEKCGADRATLPEKARQGLSRIWPDLRPVTISHEAPSVLQ